jgi:hypothetical protein
MVAPVAGQGDVLGVTPEAAAGAAGLAGQFGGTVMSAMSGAMGLFAKAQGRATTVGRRGGSRWPLSRVAPMRAWLGIAPMSRVWMQSVDGPSGV